MIELRYLSNEGARDGKKAPVRLKVHWQPCSSCLTLLDFLAEKGLIDSINYTKKNEQKYKIMILRYQVVPFSGILPRAANILS